MPYIERKISMAKKKAKKWNITREYKNIYPPQKCIYTAIRIYIHKENQTAQ